MNDPDSDPTEADAASEAPRQSPPQNPRENPWTLRLFILTFAHVIGTLHSTTILVMAPAMKADLGLTFAEFGLLVTAYSVGQVTGSLPGGNLTDRIGVGRALIAAQAILVVSALILSQATGLAQAMLAMLIAGWGYSIINPATSKGVYEAFPPARRATAMGIKQTGVPIGGVLAAMAGSLVILVSWRTVTAGIAAASVIGAFSALPIANRPVPAPPAPPTASRSRFGGFGEIVRIGNFNRFVLGNFLYNFGQYNFFTYITLFVREGLMLSQELAGLCYGAAQATSVVARTGWGAVSDFLFKGRRKGLTIVLGAVAAVLLATLGLIDPRAGLVGALALTALLGVTIASYAPLMQTMAVETVPSRHAGAAIGYCAIGTSTGAIVGPPVFGWMVDVSGAFAAGWITTAAVVGLGVALLAFGFRERRL